MSASINFYPTLDKELMEALEVDINFSFSYRQANGTYTPLEIKKEGQHITFKDTKEWSPYLDSLMVTANITYNHGCVLYGKNGIAPNESEVGVALEIFSNSGKFRHVYFDRDSKFLNENGAKELPPLFALIGKNTLNHELSLNILVYLKKKSDSVCDEELFLNNDEGVILGKLASFTVYLSGFGSLFPIYTKAIDDKKLWSLEIDYDDPQEDKLFDSVKLILNTNSKDYPYINQSDKENFCPKLIYEIVASVITILIVDLKENGYLENLDGNYADGSIMQFIKYYKETLGLDIRNPNDISSSLREYFEK